jgi:hypothetical protein
MAQGGAGCSAHAGQVRPAAGSPEGRRFQMRSGQLPRSSAGTPCPAGSSSRTPGRVSATPPALLAAFWTCPPPKSTSSALAPPTSANSHRQRTGYHRWHPGSRIPRLRLPREHLHRDACGTENLLPAWAVFEILRSDAVARPPGSRSEADPGSAGTPEGSGRHTRYRSPLSRPCSHISGETRHDLLPEQDLKRCLIHVIDCQPDAVGAHIDQRVLHSRFLRFAALIMIFPPLHETNHPRSGNVCAVPGRPAAAPAAPPRTHMPAGKNTPGH